MLIIPLNYILNIVNFDLFINVKIDPRITPHNTLIADIINVHLTPSKKYGIYPDKKLKSNVKPYTPYLYFSQIIKWIMKNVKLKKKLL